MTGNRTDFFHLSSTHIVALLAAFILFHVILYYWLIIFFILTTKHNPSKERFPGCPTHQIFVDVDWLLKDRPHNCFAAVGGGQGAHVAVELCAVYVSNQLVDGDGMVYVDLSVCEKDVQQKKGCN